MRCTAAQPLQEQRQRSSCVAQLLRFCRKNLCAHGRAQPQLNKRLQRWNTTAHTTSGAATPQRFDPRIDVLRGAAACVRFGSQPLL